MSQPIQVYHFGDGGMIVIGLDVPVNEIEALREHFREALNGDDVPVLFFGNAEMHFMDRPLRPKRATQAGTTGG